MNMLIISSAYLTTIKLNIIQAFVWYQVYKSRIFSSLDISNCESMSPLIFYDFSLISNAVLSTLAHID